MDIQKFVLTRVQPQASREMAAHGQASMHIRMHARTDGRTGQKHNTVIAHLWTARGTENTI